MVSINTKQLNSFSVTVLPTIPLPSGYSKASLWSTIYKFLIITWDIGFIYHKGSRQSMFAHGGKPQGRLIRWLVFYVPQKSTTIWLCCPCISKVWSDSFVKGFLGNRRNLQNMFKDLLSQLDEILLNVLEGNISQYLEHMKYLAVIKIPVIIKLFAKNYLKL